MPLGTAIRYLKKGEWEKAHAIVQQDESKLGCWAHGIVLRRGGERRRRRGNEPANERHQAFLERSF